MSQKPALRTARQPTKPLNIIRGIRLSRLLPVVIADPERNGGAFGKRSPVLEQRPLHVATRRKIRQDLSVFPIAEKRDLVLMSVDPMTQKAYLQSLLHFASAPLGIIDSTVRRAPSLTWEQGNQTILDLATVEPVFDDPVEGFSNAALWEDRHSSLRANAGFGAGTGHAAIFTLTPNQTSSCQTSFSGRWKLNGGARRDRH